MQLLLILRRFQLVQIIHICVKTNSGLSFQQEFALSPAQMHLFSFFSVAVLCIEIGCFVGFCKVWNVVHTVAPLPEEQDATVLIAKHIYAEHQLQHLMLHCCLECRNMLHSPNCIFPHCKLYLSKLSNVFAEVAKCICWNCNGGVQCSRGAANVAHPPNWTRHFLLSAPLHSRDLLWKNFAKRDKLTQC